MAGAVCALPRGPGGAACLACPPPHSTGLSWAENGAAPLCPGVGGARPSWVSAPAPWRKLMRRLLTQEGRAESGTTAHLPRAPGRGTQRERWRGWPGTPSVGPGDGGCRELEPLVQAGFREPAEAHPTQHLTGSLGHQAGLLGLGERQADCSTGPMGSRHPVSESRQRGHARRAVAQSAVPGARSAL